MRQKWLLGLLGIVLVVGLVALPPAPAAQAGSNGQQLVFQKAGESKAVGIMMIRVNGTLYNGSGTWSRDFSTPFTGEYRLTNYWWKGDAFVEFAVKNTNGTTYYSNCWINVPKTMSGDWIRVYLDKGSNRRCGT